jgi:hypothetical protein
MGSPILNTSTGVTEITATITLQDFNIALRKTGKNFLEWSGNISIQLAKGSLVDGYGNKNLEEIAIDAEGTMDRVEVKDELIDSETSGKMFIDDIKPEFAYVYSATNPDIDHGTETVIIVFDVIDKYFDSTTLASDENGALITVIVDDDESANTPITKTLSKVQDLN